MIENALIAGGSAPTSEVTPMGMIDRALASGASVDTIQKLMELQERWEGNQARKAFNEAISKAKSEMPGLVKNKSVDFESKRINSQTSYKYEDLASIMRQIGPILSKNGLSVRYRTSSSPNQPVSVTCILSHILGHYEENTLMAGADTTGNKNSIQAIGSTVSYLQRYTLKAALGLAASDDDDGKNSSPQETISEEQRNNITALIDETQSDIAKFCGVFGIESISQMPASEVKRAVTMLESKKRKAANHV